MRRLRVICEILFDCEKRTKGISLYLSEEYPPQWLWKLVSMISIHWWLAVMDRERPARTVGLFLLIAVTDDADRLIFSRPFGEKGLTFITFKGPKGERELEPDPGSLIDLIERGIRDRGINIREAQGVVSGRLETLGQPSVWDFKWIDETKEMTLLRVRNIQPGESRG